MRQFISFYLDNECYAIDILLVKEICQLIDTSPVPEADKHFIGIMNLRGQILTVVDPKYFLTQQRIETSEDRVLIILKTKLELIRLSKLSRKKLHTDFTIKDPLALLVDKMGETLAIEEQDILPVLPNIDAEKKEFIAGLIQRNNQFIIILALEALLKRIKN